MHGSRSQRTAAVLAGGFMEEYSKECWGDGGVGGSAKWLSFNDLTSCGANKVALKLFGA